MTEETSQSDTPAESVEAPTMEDLSQDFSVEEQVEQFQEKPAPQQQFAPDPISNPDAYNQFVDQQNQAIQSLTNTVKDLGSKLDGYENQLSQQQVDREVEQAVAVVNETLDVDPKMAELALRMEYEKDPAFKKIWDNRNQNKTKFNEALKVVADKYAGQFAAKQDHQLTKNQLAAKQSLQTMGKQPQAAESEWDGLTQAEFEAKWAQKRQG